MIRVSAPELRGARVVLRAPEPRDADELRRQHLTPEVFRWWGRPHGDFPFEEDPGTTFLTITVDDAPAGWIQFTEEPDPDYRHASIDLFVDPARHRQGLASDAIGAVMVHLVEERGHHRVTIDPSVDNAAAIACYERAGFRPVGVLRAAWRDPDGVWRDDLLMDWLAPSVSRG